MAGRFIKEVKTGKLSAELVEAFCDETEKVLSETKLSHKDILRFRYSVDAAMCSWLEEIGEGAACSFVYSKRLGRVTIGVTCEGRKCNPQAKVDEEYGKLESSSLLQSLGLSVGYSYEEGVNKLKIMPPSGFVQQLLPIVIALSLGVGLALVLKSVNAEFSSKLNEQLIDPVFFSLMNALRAIAGPLIFLAVLSGIYGIGDIASLGLIGKKLMWRFVLMTFAMLGVTLLLLLPTVNFDFGHYSVVGGGSFKDFLGLVLQFIPTDIVSPFLNGNMLQIITISVACGLVILILGERVSELTKIIDQIYSVVQLLMEAIGHLVPFFIFMSMFSFVLSNDNLEMKSILLPILGTLGSFILLGLVIYPIILMTKYKVKYLLLLKKMLPTFFVALTTASSAAAFSSNVETCEKKLGISDKITKFGVPLGQVVYMPIGAAEFLAISLIMASNWNVKISIGWIITAIFISGILSIATPPIPGGAISIFTVLFVQLNIPAVALPIALGIDLILDYIITAGDIMCLQEELVICADQLNFLDKEKLRKE